MLYQPSGDYTVTNTFATNRFGEVGLAVGNTRCCSRPKSRSPVPEAAAVVADNAARAVTLDDGASTEFTRSAT